MSSFIRTIRWDESVTHVLEILARMDDFIPLSFFPRRAQPGDHIYLAHRGEVVGRARIDRLEPVDRVVPVGAAGRPLRAQCLVHYRGGWERAPYLIHARGWPGIRYLTTVGLREMDVEKWGPEG